MYMYDSTARREKRPGGGPFLPHVPKGKVECTVRPGRGHAPDTFRHASAPRYFRVYGHTAVRDRELRVVINYITLHYITLHYITLH